MFFLGTLDIQLNPLNWLMTFLFFLLVSYGLDELFEQTVPFTKHVEDAFVIAVIVRACCLLPYINELTF
jgi:hypothetical protein